MTRRPWIDAGPHLILAAGIVVGTLVAVLAADSRWLVMGGPMVQALSVLGADALSSRLRGAGSGPTATAVLMAAAFLVAGLIVDVRDPNLVKTLVASQGAVACVAILPRPGRRHRTCRESEIAAGQP